VGIRRKYLEVDYAGGLTEEVTPWAGVGLYVELFRAIGVPGLVEKGLPVKRSEKGLRPGQMVEAFSVLSALGGECLDDFAHLRADEGLRAILGYQMPAPTTAGQWLHKAHEAALVERAKEEAAQQGFLSFIPGESAYLRALGEGSKRVVDAYVKGEAPGAEVTLDVDAHVVESAKRTAQLTYEGYRGYQPMVVSWAETNLVLRDEFRDGNVPASKDIKRVVDEAFAVLPMREDGQEWKVQVRSDAAAYEAGILDHWHKRGWEFAVSADLRPQLKEAVLALPEDEWQFWKEEKGEVVRQWAEVPYVPWRPGEKKGLEVPLYRYVAVRVRHRQGELFADGEKTKHFVVVSNRWEIGGQELLEWQRGKAGTVEHVHHVLVNELGAGVYPTDEFGANAAWLRLQVLTHNLLELMKAAVLPKEFRKARPKRLRFAVFTQWGRVVRHAGKVVVRITTRAMEGLMAPGRRVVERLAWAEA
jgi:hypothetical protein